MRRDVARYATVNKRLSGSVFSQNAHCGHKTGFWEKTTVWGRIRGRTRRFQRLSAITPVKHPSRKVSGWRPKPGPLERALLPIPVFEHRLPAGLAELRPFHVKPFHRVARCHHAAPVHAMAEAEGVAQLVRGAHL